MHAKHISTRLTTNTGCSEHVVVTRLNLLMSGNLLQIIQQISRRIIKGFMMADQGVRDCSTLVVKTYQDLSGGTPPSRPSFFSGLDRASGEAHEDGYWCISFVNRQTHRSRLAPPQPPWQGFQTPRSVVRLVNDTQIKSLVTS